MALIFEFASADRAAEFVADVSQRFETTGVVYLDQDEAYRNLWVPYELTMPVAAIARPWFAADAPDKPLSEIGQIEGEIERAAVGYGGLFRGT